ncbi:hypothetical protein ABIE24_003356 [Mycetocola sp. 2940]
MWGPGRPRPYRNPDRSGRVRRCAPPLAGGALNSSARWRGAQFLRWLEERSDESPSAKTSLFLSPSAAARTLQSRSRRSSLSRSPSSERRGQLLSWLEGRSTPPLAGGAKRRSPSARGLYRTKLQPPARTLQSLRSFKRAEGATPPLAGGAKRRSPSARGLSRTKLQPPARTLQSRSLGSSLSRSPSSERRGNVAKPWIEFVEISFKQAERAGAGRQKPGDETMAL